jgi:hypothetical protein
MHKFASFAVLALLAAACGDDPGNKPGGAGGSGGGGGSETPVAGVTVTNGAGRTFVSERPAEITIVEREGGALAEIEGWFQAADEANSELVYDVRFRLSETQLLDGAANPQLSGKFPDAQGLGKIEVDTEDAFITSKGTSDTLDLAFEEGRLTGVVTSTSSEEMAAEIEGSYSLKCSALVDGTPQEDAAFESAFCQTFAAQRPVVAVE